MSIAVFGFGCVGQGLWKVIKQSHYPGKLYVWRRKEKKCAFLTPEESEQVNFVGAEQCYDLLDLTDVEVVVELMGGIHGLPFDIVEQALKRGKKVVTANKAMLAHHMDYFANLADSVEGAALYFEGSVCGGMPILSTLTRYHVANRDELESIEGILNGSTNYLLSRLTALLNGAEGGQLGDSVMDAENLSKPPCKCLRGKPACCNHERSESCTYEKAEHGNCKATEVACGKRDSDALASDNRDDARVGNDHYGKPLTNISELDKPSDCKSSCEKSNGIALIQSVIDEMTTMGYLEADPSSDLEGHDARFKLIILARLAFGLRVSDPQSDVFTQGLQELRLEDLKFAQSLKCCIKYLGSAVKVGDASYSLSVMPTLVPPDSTFAQTNGALNAVILKSQYMGTLSMVASGAGSLPTGQAVASDVFHCLGLKAKSTSIPPYNSHSVLEASVNQKQLFARITEDRVPSALERLVDHKVCSIGDCHYFRLKSDTTFQQLASTAEKIFCMCMRT